MNNITVFIIITIFSLLVNTIITPLLIKLSHKFRWYDSNDHRKIHTGDIPRIGGFGIFVSFVLSLLLFLVICKFTSINLSDLSKYRYTSLVAGFFIITILGVIDDFISIRAWQKFLIQITAALIVSFGGFNFQLFYIPFISYNIPLYFLSHVLTVFWIISLCNAINLIDGIDGLAGGVSAIAVLFYGIIFYITGNFTAAGLSFSLLGGILGFLIFNLPPAKIFMGDSGSLFLGFSLSVIPLVNNKPPVTSVVLFLPMILLVIPILDMIGAMLRRKRRGVPIFSPDREHIHHKLMDFGLSNKKILFALYFYSFIAGITGLFYTTLTPDGGFILLLVFWSIFIILFTILHYKNQRRKKTDY
jgi:UDP-GlcNAc:undecaprenyl-phosphate/decaprenyl-phosphate GlcNAc-1-phosphate transferase